MRDLSDILRLCEGTCSAENPEDGCLAYAEKTMYLDMLLSSGKQLIILVPLPPRVHGKFLFSPHQEGNALLVPIPDPKMHFMALHNEINVGRAPRSDYIAPTAYIHPMACLGNDGIKYFKGKDGNLVKMKHMGGIQIGHNAEIGPFTNVARAVLDWTVIRPYVKLDAGVHVGHNVFIGSNTMVIQGASIGGSAKIGENCFIGLNASIRNNVCICANVLVGMGATVVKDIFTPGVYQGTPAVKVKDWDGKW